MLNNKTKIYVIGQGFVETQFVSPGDKVYALGSDLKVTQEVIAEVSSEFVYQKLNIVDSGQHNIDTTDDTRFLYYSDINGPKYIKFSEIASHTSDKAYSEIKYLPVLSTPFFAGERNTSNSELEYIARSLAVEDYDMPSFMSIINRCKGEDALVLVDMLEFWLSDDPGKGWFGRVQVKARAHKINDIYLAEEICKIAVFAGYTATLLPYHGKSWIVAISYESRPVPGSRPKNEKYFQASYFGPVYNVRVEDIRKNILGCSKGRYFYLNTVSTLNKEK